METVTWNPRGGDETEVIYSHKKSKEETIRLLDLSRSSENL